MNRVSVKILPPHGTACFYEVGAYFDDWSISFGDVEQFEQVVAFADMVARGLYELDESPFGGYYELSFEDLDEWYKEFIEGD